MKKLLVSSLVAIAFLSGCASSNTASQTPSATKEMQTVEFRGTGDYKDYKATLTSNNLFETASFKDSMGNKFDMKRAPAASGIRMISDNGVDIHFKKGEGVLGFGHGQMSLVYEDK
ncbi:MAG: hypothetical protein LUC34_01865 [Campylobacter sp.]|nr:hypothetical protein [Campylobacter sp.]